MAKRPDFARDVKKLAFDSFTVTGFKSLAEPCEIRLPGLTVLAGANSCGKSSAMQPLLLMKQTLEATFDPGGFKLDGPNVKLTKAEQAITRGKRMMEVRFARKDGASTEYLYGIGLRLECCEGRSSNGTALRLRKGIDEAEALSRLRTRFPGVELSNLAVAIDSDRCFVSLDLVNAAIGRSGWPKIVHIEPPIEGIGQDGLKATIAKLIHLPGLRGNPERSYPISGVLNSFPGTFDQYFASVLYQWGQNGGAEKLGRAGNYLADLGLAPSVAAKKVDDTRVELMVARTSRVSSRDVVNIADVGLGVSQVLPVIVALMAAAKEQIVYIEQPEIHLHPKSQDKLIGVITDAVRRGVIVVIETHSSILIRAIQTSIAQKSIAHEQVALHWFERNSKTGMSTVRLAELDADGSYGDWPVNFDDVYLESDRRYLNAVAKMKVVKRGKGGS